jgi:hypothetical protein
MKNDDNVKEMHDFPGLNKMERGAIIGYLIEFNRKIDLVRDRMAKVYDKKVGGETIKRLLEMNRSYIEDGIKQMRLDLENCQFYHLPCRLRELENCYHEAKKERMVNSYKIGEDEYQPEFKPDLPSAISAIKAAAADVHTHEKLQIEKEKGGYGEGDQIDHGIEDGRKRAG